jgi:GT2 family glycosyltransferase
VKSFEKLKRLAKKYGAKLVLSESQGGISTASNLAAASAIGEFLVFLDQDDFLEEQWWKPLHATIENADFIYSDSFHADSSGNVISTQRKPAWSPTRLIFNMYATHFMAVRRSVFEKVGGFRSEFDGSQDQDLALRISRITDRFSHVPIPLYTWRQSKVSTLSNPQNKEWAYSSGARVAQDHLQNFDSGATSERMLGFHQGAIRGKFTERAKPVSVVVPTAFSGDKSDITWAEKLFVSLESFLKFELGDEIIFVHGGEDDGGLMNRVRGASSRPVYSVVDSEPFNFSRRVNIGFEIAKNEHVLLLNDDIEFGSENPMDSLFGLLDLPNVALVGGLLTYPDFSIQHSGHAFKDGAPKNFGFQIRNLNLGVFDLLVDREVVGVTGALMFQRKSTWKAVGGFTTALPLSFNDVDYCQKVRGLGYSIIQANSVTAIHHESVTREAIDEDWEYEFINRRWFDVLSNDRYSTPYK